MSTTAVAYIRVSTAEQHLGAEAQCAAIESWAAREGVRVAAWHVDRGVSGGAAIDRRPALLAALAGLRQHGATTLVVAKRCRLARDAMNAAMIERMCARDGARVQSADGIAADDSPESQLMRTLLDAFAQYERGVIRARTKAALAAKRARSEKTGGDERYGAAEDEREAASLARQLRSEGKSLRAIGEALTAAGHRPRGRRWHPQSVSRLVSGG